ncbi:hypothetical protein PSECIP111951_00508 [Pseudoalteromonas holothuriae]|uniref:Uncharacterized protein n=1 Tax=Pseudoalteromonas holothuriae TaxID=2963714 RepID=A0A9W4VR83_9GAMM|nr:MULTISPECIES: hypothetical protein [unclassified Pseudoalteromonas]CAH9049895.1 hypothetical protein PSECIP111854_00403 [Pseudoalteromonas sp. CIP111854]CAH9051958.1 hypothetical protein PSECIP111951_00508 [Pseudoalteromonas sp. CIP111951]
MGIEFNVIILNMIVLSIAYGLIYPYCANTLKKISLQDAIAASVSLSVVGSVFYHSDARFSFIFTDMNWFWFTLVTFIALEVPLFIWYAKRYHLPFPSR